jgi:predicted lipase
LKSIRPIAYYELDNIEFYTAEDETHEWIVFRGSDSLEDWLFNIDLSMIQSEWPCNFHIHRGFLSIWNAIYSRLLSLVKNINKPVVMAGHSLGGVFATLTGLNMTTDASIYTFGMPRIGDADFVRCFEGRELIRFINKRDIVAHLPPMTLGYRHMPREIWYNDEDDIVECSLSNGEDMECSDSFPGGVSLTDHETFAGIRFKV